MNFAKVIISIKLELLYVLLNLEGIMLDMIVNCNSMEWQDAGDAYQQGTKIKVLRDDEGGRTIILKLPNGFKMREHSHIKTEQHLILKGQYEIEGKALSHNVCMRKLISRA